MIDRVLNKKKDMVVGDRLSSTYFTENKRPFHNFGNSLVRKSINLLFESDIKDIMTGYRAFSYQFVKSFPVLSKGFEIETEMSIHAVDKNMAIDNVVINYRDRPEGSVSKLSTYSDGFKCIEYDIQIVQNLQADGVLWNIGCSFSCTFRCLFYTGIDSLFVYRDGAGVSNTYCQRFCGNSCDTVIFCGVGIADDASKKPSGF